MTSGRKEIWQEIRIYEKNKRLGRVFYDHITYRPSAQYAHASFLEVSYIFVGNLPVSTRIKSERNPDENGRDP